MTMPLTQFRRLAPSAFGPLREERRNPGSGPAACPDE